MATKIGSGATPKGGESVYLAARTGFALIRSQNVFDRRFDEAGLAFVCDEHARELSNATVQADDVLLNITGDGVTFGRACLAPAHVLPACVNQHVSIIRLDRSACLPEYLLCFLTHPAVKNYIESFNAGGSRRAITKGHIESFVVPLPPLPEQARIGSALATLDQKMASNRRMNETLEAMARAIFKSWFVDFDPVRAKPAGRRPAGMDAETAALFPAAFENSDLGRIPRNWRVMQVSDACEFAYGKALTEEGRRPGRVAVFGSNGRVGWHDERLVQGPGIVIGRKGNPGTVRWASTDFFPIDTTFYVVPRPACVSLHYLFHALHHLDLPSLSADSAVPGLNRNMAYMSRILMPPQALLRAFDQLIAPLRTMQEARDRQSDALAALRDALLPKLLSGQIRIRDAEKAAQAHL